MSRSHNFCFGLVVRVGLSCVVIALWRVCLRSLPSNGYMTTALCSAGVFMYTVSFFACFRVSSLSDLAVIRPSDRA